MEMTRFKLKEEVKSLIRNKQDLKNTICMKQKCHVNTLYRWLQQDTAQSTDYNLLIEIWTFMKTNQEIAEKYNHITTIENLLIEKK